VAIEMNLSASAVILYPDECGAEVGIANFRERRLQIRRQHAHVDAEELGEPTNHLPAELFFPR
jgi:hypothetical protein